MKGFSYWITTELSTQPISHYESYPSCCCLFQFRISCPASHEDIHHLGSNVQLKPYAYRAAQPGGSRGLGMAFADELVGVFASDQPGREVLVFWGRSSWHGPHPI